MRAKLPYPRSLPNLRSSRPDHLPGTSQAPLSHVLVYHSLNKTPISALLRAHHNLPMGIYQNGIGITRLSSAGRSSNN